MAGQGKSIPLFVRKRIVELSVQGVSKVDLAATFGITEHTVYNILKNNRNGTLEEKVRGRKRGNCHKIDQDRLRKMYE